MKYLTLFITLLLAQPAIFAQTQLPIIKATSKKVSIRDGDYFDKDSWNLSPKIRPDIFTADRSRKTKWVTFYTDIDSIKVKVKPGTKYDFIVLLNGKDSCYTQIASAIPPEDRSKANIATNDTIPFTLTAYNAIQVKAILDDTTTLNLHFDIGSFDFALLKEVRASKNLKKVSKLQMGTLVWNSPLIRSASYTAHEMDGKFGWNLFEGHQVEIDYDHNYIIIHSRLPKGLKGYTRSRLEFIHGFVCAKGSFITGSKNLPGDFLMDTGSDQALIVDSTWSAKNDFPKDLKFIRSTIVRDPRGVQYETRTVLAPHFTINTLPLSDIPTLVLGTHNPTGFEINFLGNDLLKRFNIILDFRNDYLYLKPNKLTSVKYRAES